jgi:hypothetical protein
MRLVNPFIFIFQKMVYHLYGLVINSEDQLNEVPPVTPADIDIVVR